MSVLLKSQDLPAGHENTLSNMAVGSNEHTSIKIARPAAESGLFSKRNLLAKRAFDVTFAIPMLVFSLPLIGLCALLIKIISPGSAFYAQERIGKDGRRINVLKLRTMLVNADEHLQAYLEANPEAKQQWETCFKLDNDPRIIPFIGQFLRKSSFDELPQLWNIVKGDMSVVGPRPFPDYHMQAFTPAFRSLRQSVPPGLTGLWQIGPRSAGEGDIQAQEMYDTDYIRNWSFNRDLWILLRTVQVVSKGSGR